MTAQVPERVRACAFCRRRLGEEYHFSCRRCGADYCYIHAFRHEPSRCARLEARRLLASAPSGGIRGIDALTDGVQARDSTLGEVRAMLQSIRGPQD